MTNSDELTAALAKIEQLERMLATYQALDPVDTLAGDEIRSLRRRVALAEAEVRNSTVRGNLRSSVSTTAITRLDGDRTNNDLSNIRLVNVAENPCYGSSTHSLLNGLPNGAVEVWDGFSADMRKWEWTP